MTLPQQWGINPTKTNSNTTETEQKGAKQKKTVQKLKQKVQGGMLLDSMQVDTPTPKTEAVNFFFFKLGKLY